MAQTPVYDKADASLDVLGLRIKVDVAQVDLDRPEEGTGACGGGVGGRVGGVEGGGRVGGGGCGGGADRQGENLVISITAE